MTNSIFIVEDDPIIAQMISWRLQKLGYEVKGSAQTGEDALAQIRNVIPDLVLIDIMLKGEMDGIELGARITKEYGIPFIFLTAHSDNETLGRAIETNPSGFLLKPFKDEELRVSIEVALKKVSRR